MEEWAFAERKAMLKIIDELILPEKEGDEEYRIDQIDELIALSTGIENANSSHLTRSCSSQQTDRHNTVLFQHPKRGDKSETCQLSRKHALKQQVHSKLLP